MDILKERQQFLEKELEEYEKMNPMSDDEREALHWWVGQGHSVHENWSLACWEGGAPIDFLDVYREEMEEKAMLDAMKEEEQDEYWNYRYGPVTNMASEMSMEEFLGEDTPWPEL